MLNKLRRAINNTFKNETLQLPRLKVVPTDCFVASFPRAGNTWMRYLLFEIIHPDREWDLPALEKAMPIITGPHLHGYLRRTRGHDRRYFKTHDSFKSYLLRGKIVYLVRNGRDSLLSLYHYRKQIDGLSLSLSEFLQKTLREELPHGSWHTHVQGWLGNKDHPNLLVLRYEDMLADATGQLCRALHFFGFSFPCHSIKQAVERVTIQRVDEGFRRYARSRNHAFESGRSTVDPKRRVEFSPHDEALFQEVCGPTQRALGYT